MRLARQLVVGLWDRLRLAWGHFSTAESTRSRLKLPWEVDAYKGIFGSLSDTSTHAAPTPIWVPVPQLDRESLEHKPAPKDLSMPDTHRSKPLVLVASLSAGSKDGPDEWCTKRAHCIQQWCDVISIRPQSWYIVPGTDTADLDEDDLYLSVDACFGVKSIYTLHKRLKGQNLSAFPLERRARVMRWSVEGSKGFPKFCYRTRRLSSRLRPLQWRWCNHCTRP